MFFCMGQNDGYQIIPVSENQDCGYACQSAGVVAEQQRG